MTEPLVSVVTPTLDMGHVIGDTVDSVLGQDYPNVEYLVMDGGSRDGTVELLEGYGERLRFVSEPDAGQADALNRGLELTRGEVFAFLNADDRYRPGAVRAAVEGFQRNPGCSVIYGDGYLLDPAGERVAPYPTRDFDPATLAEGCYICQPAAFLSRAALESVGGFDARMECALDYELWVRMAQAGHRFARVEGVLAEARVLPASKSLARRRTLYRESIAVAKRAYGFVSWSWLEPYARFLVGGGDQFYEPSPTSTRTRVLAFALGVRHNPRAPLRLLRDMRSNGFTGRFPDGWIGKRFVLEVDRPARATRLRVSGRNEADVRRPLVLGVTVDGRRAGWRLVRRRGPFAFELPLPAGGGRDRCRVAIQSAWTWRPPADDGRRLSCYVDAVEAA